MSDKSKFLALLKAQGFTKVSFNSNNAWGFGGAIGDMYAKDGIVVKIAHACTRHLAFDTRFISIHVHGKRVLDVEQGPRGFRQAYIYLQEKS
jgi:hypothetical protein